MTNDAQDIHFENEDVDIRFQNPDALRSWIRYVIQKENATLECITYIFCSDEYLHRINVDYLNHDTYTDIITFPLSDGDAIESDVFISTERISENAKHFGIPFRDELHRVMIHGVLHLCGYKDKSDKEQQLMTEKENEALSYRSEFF